MATPQVSPGPRALTWSEGPERALNKLSKDNLKKEPYGSLNKEQVRVLGPRKTYETWDAADFEHITGLSYGHTRAIVQMCNIGIPYLLDCIILLC